MPCSDGGQAEYEREREHNEMRELLCSTCRILAAHGFDFGTNPQLDRWWNNHRKEDEAREMAEAKARVEKNIAVELTKKPLAELTSTDRQLLRKYNLL
jgi:transposase-like protein